MIEVLAGLGMMLQALTSKRCFEAEGNEGLKEKFLKLNESAAMEIVDASVNNFIRVMPLASLHGVNILLSTVGTIAQRGGIQPLVDALDKHNNKTLDEF